MVPWRVHRRTAAKHTATHAHVRARVYTHVCTHVHTRVYTRIYTHVYMHVYTHVHTLFFNGPYMGHNYMRHNYVRMRCAPLESPRPRPVILSTGAPYTRAIGHAVGDGRSKKKVREFGLTEVGITSMGN